MIKFLFSRIVRKIGALAAFLNLKELKKTLLLVRRGGGNGRQYLKKCMSLEKNIALYKEIFCALTSNEVPAGRPSSSMSEDAPGVGHHGV